MLLPKTILKILNQCCRDYLWNVQDTSHKLYMKSWSSCCCPCDEGGFNIKEILSWNKANVGKWLWRMTENVDSVWVQWNTQYHVKDDNIWTTVSKPRHSESWKGLLHVRDLLVQTTGGIVEAQALLHSCAQGDTYQVAKMYDILRMRYPRVKWSRVIWNSTAIPKHSFISSLAAQFKLPIVDSLGTRGIHLVNWCILCKNANETHRHLFFKCSYSASIWKGLMNWIKAPGRTVNLWQKLRWSTQRKTQKHWKMRIFRCCLTAAVYSIWLERNSRIFRDKEMVVGVLLRHIQYVVSVRMLYKYEIHSDDILGSLNYAS
ncbi:uncharacterized protein LOC141616992 [Silene latifolia]|uniref:uncharacterized protein LOC141616992 n=1 Tax=Silene latifolia TaxID=37657 RepID=UPI003D7722A0